MTRVRIFLPAALVGLLLLAAATALAAYQFETSWGTAGSGSGQFNGPSFVAAASDGSVYVTDTGNNRVQKFTSDGAFLTAWGSAGSGNAQFSAPQGVAAGPDGSVYVVDQGNSRVERFDSNGGFLSTWGSPGALDGQFNAPTGVAAGPDGSVYVADAGNKRLERFLADGTFLSSFSSGAGGFANLQGVATGPDGSVYAVDGEPGDRVEHFDASGTFQGAWGSAGTGDGQFQAPRGIAASSAGVYVADSGQARIEKFTSTGAFIDTLDGSGSGDSQFSAPFGIAISPNGPIYISFNAANRVARYSETGGGAGSLPPPQTGSTANAEPVGGTVKVRKPGSNTFELLPTDQQIPIGSIVDVTHGRVSLTTTASSNTTQTSQFYGGVFQLLQDKSKAPVTEAKLFGGTFKGCPKAGKASAARKKKAIVRSLWGVGKGRFRTKGKYAAAAIRGTQWYTADRCDGTLVRVKTGVVTVRDLVKKVNVTVKAPKSYLAAPKKRK